VPLTLGAKPKQSQRSKLDTLLANTQVPGVLAAAFLSTSRRFPAGHSPANAFEANALAFGTASRAVRVAGRGCLAESDSLGQ
jgi:hypothetical protein